MTPIDTASETRAGRPISVGAYSYPTSITLAPGGQTAVVLGTYDGTVRLLNTRTRQCLGADQGGRTPRRGGHHALEPSDTRPPGRSPSAPPNMSAQQGGPGRG